MNAKIDTDHANSEYYGGDADRAIGLQLPPCAEIFSQFDPEHLASRLPRVSDPDLWSARDADQFVGFKLGYRRGAHSFHSWLGGVHPSARRRGTAAELTHRQHARAVGTGYRLVETRTRAVKNGMRILNLRHGFRITAFEVDSGGCPVATQRKDRSET